MLGPARTHMGGWEATEHGYATNSNPFASNKEAHWTNGTSLIAGLRQGQGGDIYLLEF